MTSGSPDAVERARPVLDALTQKPEGKLQVVGDICGAASDFKLINQVLCTAQITMAGYVTFSLTDCEDELTCRESMAFGRALGLNPRMLYNLIRKSSGNSFMFGHRGPWQLRPDGTLKSAMTICAKDSGIIMDEARLYNFPCPLTSATEQVMNMAIAAGLSRVDDGCISLLWEKYFGVGQIAENGTEEEEEEKAKELSVQPTGPPQKVLFVGLGMMGTPMALAVQKAGMETVGLDISKEAMEAYVKAGGKAVTDIAQEARDADVVVLVTNTAAEAGVVLFAVEGGLASGESQEDKIGVGANGQHYQTRQRLSYHQQSRPPPLELSKSNSTL
jgi:3-hydroxyisobutyrate dehydrogenase-like beta-hydroxyacid dehydrogenase